MARISISSEVKRKIVELKNSGLTAQNVVRELSRLKMFRNNKTPIPIATVYNVMKAERRSVIPTLPEDPQLVPLKRRRSRMMTLEVPPPQLTCKLFLLTGSPDEIAQFSRSL